MSYKRNLIPLLTVFMLIACSQDQQDSAAKTQATQSPSEESMSVQPPVAKKIDHLLNMHGSKRNDPYYWLRDDTRKSKDVLNYLAAENNYTKAKLAHTEDLQKKLYTEMTGRLEPNEESVPVFYKNYWSWSKFTEGKDYSVHLRKKGNLEAQEEVLLDENQRATGHEYYRLASLKLSPDQNLMAISEDVVSRRRYNISIMNLSTGRFEKEVIKNTSGQIVWANDNQTIFYVRKDPVTLLPFQVYRHKLGTSSDQDILVYEEKDNTFYTGIYKTTSDKFIVISSESTMNSEARAVSADQPTDEFKLIIAREKDHRYQVDHIGGYFYIQSDLNAPNEKLLRVSDKLIGSKKHWQKILPTKEDTLLQGFTLFNDYMVVNERVNGLEQLRIRDLEGKLIESIQFNDQAYTADIDDNPDPMSKVIRYHYSSMNTPDSIYEYDFKTKKSRLLKQDKVLGDFNPSNYQSERILITARDGKKVPVSLVYRKDKFKKTGRNPLLNYAYGSYGYTIDPSFSVSRLSLLDRGFVYAISHIRGSKMLGRQWYEDGKKLTKIHTFTDYIDATKALVEQGYADKNKVFAMGGSAGGLLMGGVVNMAPELFDGVIAAVPFVDVVTTMLDESIPLTTGEYDEWGNPNEKQYYDYMLSYSPYDQVKAQDYPNMLVTTGLHDSQVQYWEPAKWVAKLRDLKTDHNTLLLDIDMESGHGGKSGRYKSFLERAKEYAFVLDLAGIKE